jgi:hypothetical protein
MPEKASPRLAFLFAAIHGAHPAGPSSLRSNVQNRSRRFFTFCCPAKCPSGQLKLLKIAPGDFLHFAILQNALRACMAQKKFIPMQLNACMMFLPPGHA